MLSVHFLDRDQVVHFANHASNLRVIRLHYTVVHSTDPQMPERDLLRAQPPNRTSNLGDLELFCHRLADSRPCRRQAVSHLLRFFERRRRLLVVEFSHAGNIFPRSQLVQTVKGGLNHIVRVERA